MTQVLFGICTVLTMMVIVLAAMGWSLNKEVGDQYEEIKELRDRVSGMNKRLTSLEGKKDKACDKIVIVHEYNDSDAPKYGEF